MTELSYEQGLRMAKLMKKFDSDIRKAIINAAVANHGVVALRFIDDYCEMVIETLDEPYGKDVRIYLEPDSKPPETPQK